MSSSDPTGLTFVITEVDTDGSVAQIGGLVKRLTAGGTLLIGDVVYLSAATTVNKSTTNADYAKFIGVVIGGASFSSDGSACTDSTLVGQTAAVNGEFVIVQTDGIAYLKSAGAILAGSTVIPSTATAGQCTVAGANPGYTLGIALEAISSGNIGRMLIRWGLDEV